MFLGLGPIMEQQNSLIKSIQEVEITIGSAATSNTATLGTTVVKDNSIMLWLGTRLDTGAAGDCNTADCRIELTDNSTCTAYVNSTASGNRVVRGVVCEFYPFVLAKAVVHGTVSISNGSTSGVGGPANYADSSQSARLFHTYLGATNSFSGDAARISTRFADLTGSLGGSNSMTGARQGNQGNMVVGFCQWIFNPGILKSFDFVQANVGSGQTSQTTNATIGGHTLKNCLNFLQGWNYSDGFASNEIYGYQNSANQFTAARADSGSQSVSYIKFRTAEFADKWVKGGKQAGQPQIADSTFTQDTTLTAFNPAKTLLSYLGHACHDAFANIDYTFTSVETVSGTVVRAKRNADYVNGSNPITSFEAFEFR